MNNLQLKGKKIRLNELVTEGTCSNRGRLEGFCRQNINRGEELCLYDNLKPNNKELYCWLKGEIVDISFNKEFNKPQIILNNNKKFIITEIC